MSKYTVHPAAELFPLVEGDEFFALVADIKANGLIEPISIQGNVILDGRNRLRACEAAGIAPHYKEVTAGTDPLRYITSRNIHRRHLTTTQRAAIAAEMANLEHGGQGGHVKGSNDPLRAISIDEAAALLNVSTPSVKRAKKVMRENPEAHKAALRGEKTKPQKPAAVKQEPTMKTMYGWQTLAREVFPPALSNGTYSGAIKPLIEKHLGAELPRQVPVDAIPAFKAAVHAAYDEWVEDPKNAPQDQQKEDLRAALSKSSQEKLDSAIRREKARLKMEFDAAVHAQVSILLAAEKKAFEDARKRADEREAEYTKLKENLQRVSDRSRFPISEAEFKVVRNFLHPDRHNGNADKANKVFEIFNRLESFYH